MASIDPDLLRLVIRRLLEGGDHRLAVSEAIERQFFAWAIQFLKNLKAAKRRADDVEPEHWYQAAFLSEQLPTAEIAACGGLPLKTIGNVYGSQRRAAVVEATRVHHVQMQDTIAELLAIHGEPAFRIGDSDVALSSEETLIAFNALAVRRAQFRGGYWSAVGKAAEVPLMRVLCALFVVKQRHWRVSDSADGRHQVDFVLLHQGPTYRCEVKLMGRGNPESFKAALPNDARLLVADHLSEQARDTLRRNNVEWVALSDPNGWRRFGDALAKFGIPHEEVPASLEHLDAILDQVLGKPG